MNIRIILISLVIWFACSFGAGILLRPALSGISYGGTDIGFWFAQQGSILIFLVLIFVYARLMKNSPRYAAVTQADTPREFAQGLQQAGYATDPAYADKLTRIINTTLRLQRSVE